MQNPPAHCIFLHQTLQDFGMRNTARTTNVASPAQLLDSSWTAAGQAKKAGDYRGQSLDIILSLSCLRLRPYDGLDAAWAGGRL